MRAICWLFAAAAFGGDTWLAGVSPLMNREEKARYAVLNEDEREAFRTSFWVDKKLTADAYFSRLQHVEAHFGSANTDAGRLYLSLGPPTSIARLPASRVFVPCEVWYYDGKYQFLLFQARSVGDLKLYSPQIHTIRALMVPQPGTRGMFGVNDEVTESDIMDRLRLSPAELEIAEAAQGIARGIKGVGNGEVIYRVLNPAVMLRKDRREAVESRVRFEGERPKFETAQYLVEGKLPAVDVRLTGVLQKVVTLEVRGVESFATTLNLAAPQSVVYVQRLYLLPGEYTVIAGFDGRKNGFVLKVKPTTEVTTAVPAEPDAMPADRELPILYRANLQRTAAWAAVGNQYLLRRDLAQAKYCFEKARAESAGLAGLGKIEILQGHLDEGRKLLELALALEPDRYDALAALAGVAAEMQDFPRAEKLRERAEAIRSQTL